MKLLKGQKKEATKRLRELLTALDKGTFIKPGKATLAEYLNAWLAASIKPNLAGKTYELYSYICNQHIIPSIGKYPLVELKPQHIQHLYAEKQSLGLSNRTIQIIHVVLHKALKNACKMGLLSRNVTEAVESPKIQRHEMKVMNESDIHLFLEMARNTEYYALFYTLLFTGMRRGEALSLHWQDVDLLLCQLSVTKSKTGKDRAISLSPSTVSVLREHHDTQNKHRQALDLPQVTDSDFVFSHWNGSPLIPSSITHAWMKLARRCGLTGVRLHDARHTHASLMLKQGIHPKIVQERLGHAGIAITLDLYSHVSAGLQQAAANRFGDIIIAKQEAAIKSD